MSPLEVLVLGATGRYSALVASLLAAGHHVLAATREPDAARAQALRQAGVELVRVDLTDVASIAAAARGADTLFAGGTAHRVGPAGDAAHGRNVVDGGRAAGVGHVVYVSVAGADRPTAVPIFESKRAVEEHLVASGVPFTIVAPVYFMENLWNPWNVPLLASGCFPSPIPADRPLQQIAIESVTDLVSHVIAHRDDFLGTRLEIASDELTALEAAAIVGSLTRREIRVETAVNGGPAPLFSWLDRVGYKVDLGDLRKRFPAVAWPRFREWATMQDWSILDGT